LRRWFKALHSSTTIFSSTRKAGHHHRRRRHHRRRHHCARRGTRHLRAAEAKKGMLLRGNLDASPTRTRPKPNTSTHAYRHHPWPSPNCPHPHALQGFFINGFFVVVQGAEKVCCGARRPGREPPPVGSMAIMALCAAPPEALAVQHRQTNSRPELGYSNRGRGTCLVVVLCLYLTVAPYYTSRPKAVHLSFWYGLPLLILRAASPYSTQCSVRSLNSDRHSQKSVHCAVSGPITSRPCPYPQGRASGNIRRGALSSPFLL